MSTFIPSPTLRVSLGADDRPTLKSLVKVELRKMLDTRAGLWLQVAIVALTLVVVVVRSSLGDASHHTFQAILDVALAPAAFLLPVAAVLLVTSEWSQRTGMITFTLVP